MAEVAEMVRVNARISKTLNDWLDKRSKETGVPKSTLIFLGLEQYMVQNETMAKMNDMGAIFKQMEQLVNQGIIK